MKHISRKQVTAILNIVVLVPLWWVITLLPGTSHHPSSHRHQEIKSPAKTIKVNGHTDNGQGLYESCAPRYGVRCFDRLRQMAGAGFTLVINYDQLYGTAQQELDYAQQAYALHMKVIWSMENPVFWNGTNLLEYYGDLAATCGCSNNKGFIRYVITLVKNLPATWGYYIGDEVSVSNHSRMKAFADIVRRLDPSHPRLYVSAQGTSTTAGSLANFADTAEVIGEDVYPVGTTQSIGVVGDVAQTAQHIADLNKKQSVVVLQAFSWGQYPKKSWSCTPFPSCAPFPTRDQMRQMYNLVLRNAHPRLILWYSYFDIARSDNPATHWTDLVQAASPTTNSYTRR